jgi:ATP-binding cassette subfamily B protein
MLTQREAAAEMRLFGLGLHFRAHFRDLCKRLRREKVQIARSEAIAHAAAALIGLASMAAALAWMGFQALSLFFRKWYKAARSA